MSVVQDELQQRLKALESEFDTEINKYNYEATSFLTPPASDSIPCIFTESMWEVDPVESIRKPAIEFSNERKKINSFLAKNGKKKQKIPEKIIK